MSQSKNRSTKIETLEKKQLFSTVGWDCPVFENVSEEAPAVVASQQLTTSEEVDHLFSATDDHANGFRRATLVHLDSAGNGSQAGDIERRGDQDMIRFTATQTGRMTITQNATDGSQLDSFLYAYDSDRQQLARNDDGGSGLNSRLQINVVSGRTYYVKADAYRRSTGRYELGFSTEQRDDHGNSFANATGVALISSGSGSVSGNIERAGDRDMIRFTATQTGRMTVTQNASNGSELDTFLYAYDSDRQQLARDDDGGSGLNSRLQINVVSGRTYYVRADAYGSSTGTYELAFSTEQNDDHGNDFSNATGINLTSSGSGNANGNIERAGDQDMIRFNATQTGRMTVTQNASNGSELDTLLYAYDSGGRQLARNDDGGTGFDSRLQIDVVAGETYYVRADAYGSSTGQYEVALSTEILDDHDDDHGNDFDNATQIQLSSTGSSSVSGDIERVGDQDMIRFTATQTGLMTITQSASSGSQLDTYLYAYDSQRQQLASDDDGGAGLNSRLQIDVVAGETYYVRADAYRDGSGRYEIGIHTESESTEFGENELYLNFDGVTLSAVDMDRYASDLDPENDGVRVNSLFANRSDREVIVSGIMARVQADLDAFGITVRRHFGQTVENRGATTIYVGPSNMFHPHIASDIDFGNDNPTDIAFVGEENWGNADDIITALSDVVLHEAGHTYGVYHVNSVQNGTIYNETMGLRYSTHQSEWLRDTSFLDRSFREYGSHGGGRGMQNTHQVLAANFGLSGNGISVSSFDQVPHVLDHLLPVYASTDSLDLGDVAESNALTLPVASSIHAMSEGNSGCPMDDLAEVELTRSSMARSGRVSNLQASLTPVNEGQQPDRADDSNGSMMAETVHEDFTSILDQAFAEGWQDGVV